MPNCLQLRHCYNLEIQGSWIIHGTFNLTPIVQNYAMEQLKYIVITNTVVVTNAGVSISYQNCIYRSNLVLNTVV